MNKESYLLYLPLVLTLLVVICYSGLNSLDVAKKTMAAFDMADACASCPSEVTETDCISTGTPVLGGVDLVNYFVAYKNADGTYDETQTGVAGSIQYSTTYNGYTFYFSTESNLKLFESSPSSYVPQWGGFCSWGVATETCPSFPWSTSCMGPYGDWSHWTIINDKIYFFWYDEAKDKFLEDPDTYIAAGDERWSGWYGDSYTTFNTNCYVD